VALLTQKTFKHFFKIIRRRGEIQPLKYIISRVARWPVSYYWFSRGRWKAGIL